jgi:hypothetical protein
MAVKASPAVNTLTLIRQAANQSGFAKKIFTQGASGLSAAQVTMEFRQLLVLAGVAVPKELAVSLDAAQIILAGGAIANDFARGAATLQCVGDISTGVAGLAALFGDLGLIDHQLADFASLGANVALALSSGGANVLADIGAVISLFNVVGDLATDFGGSDDVARMEAMKGLSQAIKQYYASAIKPQIDFASIQAAAYQSGKLNYFDFVANIATHSPIEFQSFFPQLSTYFPSWMWDTMGATFRSVGTSSGWFSDSVDVETKTLSFRKLAASHAQIESVLFNHLLAEPLQAFESFFEISNGISIKALSVLSMILNGGVNGDVRITQDFNVLKACLLLGVTPSILGDDFAFKGFVKNENIPNEWDKDLPYTPMTIPMPRVFNSGGLVINGVVSESPQERTSKKQVAELVAFQKYLQHLDATGNIEALVKIPEGLAILKRWASIRHSESFGMTNAGRLIENSKQIAGVLPSLDPKSVDFSDYWKCLGVAKKMQESNLFSDGNYDLVNFGNLDDILKQVKDAFNFVVSKNLNRLARQNVSKSVGIPFNQLATRTDSKKNLIFYRKVI